MWDTLKLKLEEASFFAGQLAGFTRHPKVFLFHLSAFLTSARSVTFHLQKQLSASGKKQYEALRDAILADEEAGYFVQARNRAEKEGYPSVSVAQLVAYEDEAGKLVWTQYANTILPGAT